MLLLSSFAMAAQVHVEAALLQQCDTEVAETAWFGPGAAEPLGFALAGLAAQGTLVGHPRLLTNEGENAKIVVSGPEGSLSLDVTPTVDGDDVRLEVALEVDHAAGSWIVAAPDGGMVRLGLRGGADDCRAGQTSSLQLLLLPTVIDGEADMEALGAGVARTRESWRAWAAGRSARAQARELPVVLEAHPATAILLPL